MRYYASVLAAYSYDSRTPTGYFFRLLGELRWETLYMDYVILTLFDMTPQLH